MKNILLTVLSLMIISTGVYAEDYDRYYSLGGGNVNYDQTNYSDAKSVHIKLGLTQENGFGLELEHAITIDPLTDNTTSADVDVMTTAAYATYRIMLNGEFNLKGRLGFLDHTLKTATTKSQYETKVSYGLQLDYEPIDNQVVYLGYTVSDLGTNELIVISAGMQFFF